MRFGQCPRLARVLCVAFLFAATLSFAAVDLSGLPKVVTHDNLKSAGVLKDGVLTVHLTLKEGAWHPDADDGAAIPALTVAEEEGAPSMPGPMIRVPEGTRIHAYFRNTQIFPVFLHGMNTRPGDAKSAVAIPPMQTKEFDFVAGAPGTYFYYVTCFQSTPVDALTPTDTTMTGAFIVDAKGAATDDRVLVINFWYTWLVAFDLDHGFNMIITVNGKQWPHTTRMAGTVGEPMRWRVINASVAAHPMHLHGAHFRVDSAGNMEKEDIYSAERQRLAVTELMQPGRTMAVTWTPTHAGNWIFHCHLTDHFDASLGGAAARVIGVAATHEAEDDHGGHQMHKEMAGDGMGSGMSGLVIGVNVKPRDASGEASAKAPLRTLTLTLSKNPPNPETHRRCVLVELRDGGKIAASAIGSELGPPIVLYRGQPTAITVVNKLGEQTAIHWHGIELESYYDGVPGYGGDSRQVTPPIADGDSFTAHMTPPRAGTYMYHTHWHDVGQLTTGLYGPLIVLEPGEKYDPEHDRTFLVSSSSPNFLLDAMLLNGFAKPGAIQLRAGDTYRFRFINISPSLDDVHYTLLDGKKPTQWQPLAKDGADLPAFYQKAEEAKGVFAPGETYDYVFKPENTAKLALHADSGASHIVLPVEVVGVKEALARK